jgi:hypothetical protein
MERKLRESFLKSKSDYKIIIYVYYYFFKFHKSYEVSSSNWNDIGYLPVMHQLS